MRFHLHSIQFFVISLLMLLAGCRKNTMKEIEAIVKKDSIQHETARDVTIILSDSGQIRSVLKTPLMLTYGGEDPHVEMPEGLFITFYDQNHQPNGYMTARYGKRYTLTRIIEIKENVVVVNTRNDTFTTEFLTWNERKNRVYTDHYVRVKTRDEIITGKGFESDVSFTDYEFRNIKGVIGLNQ
jgi:LPS export ABC transporter protein LptC